jgi:hypothetical protein
MRSVTARTQTIHEQVETLTVAIGAWLRYAPCVLLALLLGVLNPALCVLHCALLHSPLVAQGSSLTRAHHSHDGNAGSSGHDRGICATTGLPETAQLMPRAGYELMPVALALAALVLAALTPLPGAPRRRLVAQFPQPLTPPPKTLAFS